MNVLITGAAGQLGKCLKDVLATSEFQCLFLSHSELDICDQVAIEKKIEDFQPHVIINTAAFTAVDQAEDNPKQALKTNVEAIAYLISAANKVGAIIIHFSTDYVFSGEGSAPFNEVYIPAPLNEYGVSKWRGEKILQDHANKYVIIRSSWLFSEYGNNFVTKILARAKVQSELSVVCDEVGAPTYARDLAEVVMQLLIRYKQTGDLGWGIYHYCGSPAVSRYEFAEEILTLAAQLEMFPREKIQMRKMESIEVSGATIKRPLNAVLDCSKIKDVFGIEQPGWRDGLVKCIKTLTQEEGNEL